MLRVVCLFVVWTIRRRRRRRRRSSSFVVVVVVVIGCGGCGGGGAALRGLSRCSCCIFPLLCIACCCR